MLGAIGAQAADLSSGALPTAKGPTLSQNTTWDGFYFGLNGGVAYSFDHWTDPSGVVALPINTPRFPASGNSVGEFAGLTIGYNKQFGPWVVGAEGDIDASGVWGHAVCGGIWGVGGLGWKCVDSDRIFGTVSARLGYATGRTLLFAKAGVAIDDYKAGMSFFNPPFPSPTISQTETRVGAAFGVGVEYALSPNWSAKGEYDLIDYGKRSFARSWRRLRACSSSA